MTNNQHAGKLKVKDVWSLRTNNKGNLTVAGQTRYKLPQELELK